MFENLRCMSKTCYTFRSSSNTFRPRVERDLEGLTGFAEQLVGPGTDPLTLDTQMKSRSRKRSRRTGPFALIPPKVLTRLPWRAWRGLKDRGARACLGAAEAGRPRALSSAAGLLPDNTPPCKTDQDWESFE